MKKASKRKRVKAWCIIDMGRDGTLENAHGSLMVDRHKTLRRDLHKDYESVPCTITYSPPTP